MTKKLLILLGSTDISRSDYKLRYSLIAREAEKRGYVRIEFVLWEGQESGKKGVLNCKTAIATLKKKLHEYDNSKTLFDIIAFSFGTNICLNVLFNNPIFKNLSRTVLWGIGQYWEYYDYFSEYGQLKHKDHHKKSGYNLDKNIMSTFFPNEIILREYPHDNLILIGFGEYDNISPVYYKEYLEKFICRDNIKFFEVKGIGHKVIEYNKEYINFMFKDNLN